MRMAKTREYKRRKPVHFLFETHFPNDSAMEPRRKYLNPQTKTFVYEDASGVTRPLTPADLEGVSLDSFSPRTRSKIEAFKEAFRLGIPIVPGELMKPSEVKRYRQLETQTQKTRAQASSSFALNDIKKYHEADAAEYRMRHEIIRRTLRESAAPLVANFGIIHSTLSRELRDRGIETSRDIQPQVFNWNEIVLRKMLLNQKPTDLEHKKAFLSALFSTGLIENGLMRTGADHNFFAMLETALFKNLEQNEARVVEQMLRTKDLSLLFEANGLPATPTPTQLHQFLGKHSAFYTRESEIRKKK
jgi:hypothetical protein